MVTRPDSLQPHDLMTAVRKTNFDNEELQDLIDILLNKQQNSPMVQNGSWVDPQTNEMKQLQRALEESGKALEFEQVYSHAPNRRNVGGCFDFYHFYSPMKTSYRLRKQLRLYMLKVVLEESAKIA